MHRTLTNWNGGWCALLCNHNGGSMHLHMENHKITSLHLLSCRLLQTEHLLLTKITTNSLNPDME